MSQLSPDASPAPTSAGEQSATGVAERTAAVAAASAEAASAEAADTPLNQLLKFVEAADKQVSNTSTTFGVVALVVCGLALVLLPAIFVFAGGTARFPNVDYLVTSLIGAVLLIGTVVGFVVNSRGRSQDRKAAYSAGADLIGRLNQSAASSAAAQLVASEKE